MGLEVDIIEYPPDRPGADRHYDPIGGGLSRQVFTGPVGDAQPLGQRLQAGKFDDPSSLEGGNRGWSPRMLFPAVGE